MLFKIHKIESILLPIKSGFRMSTLPSICYRLYIVYFLVWYKHVMRRNENKVVKRVLNGEGFRGRGWLKARKRGRLKKK